MTGENAHLQRNRRERIPATSAEKVHREVPGYNAAGNGGNKFHTKNLIGTIYSPEKPFFNGKRPSKGEEEDCATISSHLTTPKKKNI